MISKSIDVRHMVWAMRWHDSLLALIRHHARSIRAKFAQLFECDGSPRLLQAKSSNCDDSLILRLGLAEISS